MPGDGSAVDRHHPSAEASCHLTSSGSRRESKAKASMAHPARFGWRTCETDGRPGALHRACCRLGRRKTVCVKPLIHLLAD